MFRRHLFVKVATLGATLGLLSAFVSLPGFTETHAQAASSSYDLNFGTLDFGPDADLYAASSDLSTNFSRRYENVALINGQNIDAMVTFDYNTGLPNNELATFDQYDDSQHLSFHTQVNGSSTAQASARMKVQFLADGTNTPVVLNNIRLTVADIDTHEFVTLYNLSSYQFSSPTNLSLQTSPVPPAGQYPFISSSTGASATDPVRIVEATYAAASSLSVLAGCRANAVNTGAGANGKCGFTVTMGTDLLTGLTTDTAVTMPAYAITYNSNGSSSGTAPASTTASGTQTIANNTGGLQQGTNVFLGWNTKADGSGFTVEPGSSYVPSSNVTLYAVYGAPPAFTVTFNDNDPSPDTTGTMSPQTSASAANLTSENFTRPGYTFTGWNTQADGNGTDYTDGASYAFTADMTLYAQWEPITHTVTFSDNAPVGSATGTMTNQVSATAANFTTSNFGRTGYEFVGWNTAADGSGAMYADRANFPFDQDLTLYAQWAAVVIQPTPSTVTFSSNGGTGTMPSQTETSEQALDSESFTRTGYTFAGWNTQADGNGTNYTDGASYAFTADMTLYAQWEPLPHTVTFSDNAPVGSTTGTMTPQTSANTTDLTAENYTRTGYTFTGWNTQADGNGTNYTDAASYAFTADMTLYAQWEAVVIAATSYTVTFDDNAPAGSTTGTMNPQTSANTTDLTAENYTRTGYTFTGWDTQADGNGTDYTDAASYAFTADMTLYAQWEPTPHTVTFMVNEGAGSMAHQVSAVQAHLASETFTRTGYTFTGWNTQADGNGTDYTDAASYAFTADMTLYAQWEPLPHTVSFMSNGSTETMADQTSAIARDISMNTLTRAGYVFAGWNTKADGSGLLYADEAAHAFTEDLTLYAIWAAVAVPAAASPAPAPASAPVPVPVPVPATPADTTPAAGQTVSSPAATLPTTGASSNIFLLLAGSFGVIALGFILQLSRRKR